MSGFSYRLVAMHGTRRKLAQVAQKHDARVKQLIALQLDEIECYSRFVTKSDEQKFDYERLNLLVEMTVGKQVSFYQLIKSLENGSLRVSEPDPLPDTFVNNLEQIRRNPKLLAVARRADAIGLKMIGSHRFTLGDEDWYTSMRLRTAGQWEYEVLKRRDAHPDGKDKKVKELWGSDQAYRQQQQKPMLTDKLKKKLLRDLELDCVEFERWGFVRKPRANFVCNRLIEDRGEETAAIVTKVLKDRDNGTAGIIAHRGSETDAIVARRGINTDAIGRRRNVAIVTAIIKDRDSETAAIVSHRDNETAAIVSAIVRGGKTTATKEGLRWRPDNSGRAKRATKPPVNLYLRFYARDFERLFN